MTFNHGIGAININDPSGYVVGSFTEQGGKIKEGHFADNEVAIARAQAILRHANGAGGELLRTTKVGTIQSAVASVEGVNTSTVKAENIPLVEEVKVADVKVSRKKNKSILNTKPVEVSAIDKLLLNPDIQPVAKVKAPEYSQIDIVFAVSLGKIKVKAIGVLDSAIALGIIFESAEDIVYEPEAGAEFDILANGVKHPVLYTGVNFTWLDGIKRILLFTKRSVEE